MKFIKFTRILLCSAILLAFAGCDTASAVTEKTAFDMMDTVAKVTVYGGAAAEIESAVDAAFGRLAELDNMLDYNDPNSELSRINAAAYGKAVEISNDMAKIIEKGLELSEITGGAFDISLGSLIELYGHEQPPAQEEIDALLPYIGYENIYLQFGALRYDPDVPLPPTTVKFANGYVKMHFGAIAKGYALDEMCNILLKNGVESAIIEFGGEISVIGESPRNGGLWKIGIRDPFGGDSPIESVTLSAGTAFGDGVTAATSGAYERGEHIFDRRTGRPAESEFASVTVIHNYGAGADALATAAYVAGWDIQAEEKEGWYCGVGITKEGEIVRNHSGNCHYCSGNTRGGGTYMD